MYMRLGLKVNQMEYVKNVKSVHVIVSYYTYI